MTGAGLLLLCAVLSAGCSTPSKANIQLRKDNDVLRDEIRKLKIQHEGDVAKIGVLEDRTKTIPNLAQSRLDKLSTAHGLKFGRLTSGADLDVDKPGDEGFKVEAIVFDGDGDPIKSLGAFTIDAFDLSDPNPKIGSWRFTSDDSRKNFFSTTFLYAFIFDCRWQRVPAHSDITIKVTFVDELTQRTFAAEKQIKVQLPPRGAASQPASATAQGK